MTPPEARLSDVERGYARDGDGITMRGRWYSEASVERILAARLAEAEQVRREHGERIAQAIEAEAARLARIRVSTANFAVAARIARQEQGS